MTADVQPLVGLRVAAPPAVMGWREAVGASARVVVERPAVIGVGLLGFLARGGLVAFLLPIVVLPTPTGVSNFIGGTAITGAGASDGLIQLIAVAVLLVGATILLGAVLGAAADILLGREALAVAIARERGVVSESALAAARRDADAAVAMTPTLAGRVLVVRISTLVPIALAVAWGTARLVDAGYHQLILPDDVSLPLAVRILREALPAAIAVVAVWLAAEYAGGLVVRVLIVEGRSAGGAVVAGLAGAARRPLTSLASYLLGVVAVGVPVVVTVVLAALLWSRLQALLADDVSFIFALPATLLFVLVWLGGLVLTGAAVAWRSILGTLDVLRAGPARTVSTLPASVHGPAIAMPAGGQALEDR